MAPFGLLMASREISQSRSSLWSQAPYKNQTLTFDGSTVQAAMLIWQRALRAMVNRAFQGGGDQQHRFCAPGLNFGNSLTRRIKVKGSPRIQVRDLFFFNTVFVYPTLGNLNMNTCAFCIGTKIRSRVKMTVIHGSLSSVGMRGKRRARVWDHYKSRKLD